MARREEGRTLYNRLSHVRIAKGFTRAELADLVGVNVQTIGALERGQYYPSLYVAMLIAEACRVELPEVFAWDPSDFGQFTEGETS